jgi:hypothetical protein
MVSKMPSLVFNAPIGDKSNKQQILVNPEIPLAKGGIKQGLIPPPKPSLIKMMPDIKLPPMPLPPTPQQQK